MLNRSNTRRVGKRKARSPNSAARIKAYWRAIGVLKDDDRVDLYDGDDPGGRPEEEELEF